MKHKYDNTPKALSDLKRIFSQGITYDDFEEMILTTDKTLESKYKNSIYKRCKSLLDLMSTKDINELSFLIRMCLFYYWSKQKEIFQFDEDFANELMQTPVTNIPYESLKHLPYDTFVATHGNSYTIVHKGYDKNHVEDDYLMIGTVSVDDRIDVIGMPLNGKFSSIDDMKKICRNHEHLESTIKALNLVIYLASDEPEIEPNPEQKTITSRNPNAKIKNSYKELRKWDVGYRFGSAFRKHKAKQSSNITNNNPNINITISHSKKAPHIRKGHWHNFWTGSENNKSLKIKWLSPIVVNNENTTTTTAVVHKTKKEQNQ